jgi:DNA-binding LytR/AlgR family response regulator
MEYLGLGRAIRQRSSMMPIVFVMGNLLYSPAIVALAAC